MPRRKFDKKSAKTFSIVHRAHDDALYYDNDASKHVLVPAPTKRDNKAHRPKKVFTTSDLEGQLTPKEIQNIRANEGLAAQYGIFFDDSKYDYMQHLKPIGQSGDGIFIERQDKKDTKEKKIDPETLFKDQLPSEKQVKHDHALQSIPYELQGFNPNLDPRIREVLEALEDEAYIEEQKSSPQESDEDVFATLLKSGEAEGDELYDEFDGDSDAYDEWDMDNYEDEYSDKYDSDNFEEQELPYNKEEAPEDALDSTQNQVLINNNWQKDFERFKKESKNRKNDWDSDDDFESEAEETIADLPDIKKTNESSKKSNTKLRKKKGAMTDCSSFSMSSSALFRTEGLTLLDDRYEQYAKKYSADDDEHYEEFQIENERGDLEELLDDFLNNYELESGGRKLVRKNEEKSKIQESADSVSKSKVAARRNKERNNTNSISKLGGSFRNMRI
ncbi:Piso0_005754 [Millerozyma farinosa CBS 7064]|uniref:Piso0_005754 protein n=1 Tax=Pichia sorbitophila (strain ATCC MYA-4447 / BCRC 22081 / CBS 7064 / NBRC 10061 / NRRL Y-12695) TaxID=559304 RepID=G8XZV2_PICSO|nr:Piso0_005754 [Millerozyma farinosa CBS 7064]